MERITFDQLPEMVALILEKLDHIEKLLGKGETVQEHLGKEMLTATEAISFLGISKSKLYKMSYIEISLFTNLPVAVYTLKRKT